jgi:hypothetical protein
MKSVIIALALTAILATSAVAKIQRTKEARIQTDNTVAEFNNSYCHYHYAHTDPDPRIRLQLRRDCKSYESAGSQ